jgi:hypothetical protein
MNKPFSGVMYLLFCWTFVPLLISLIEVIFYLCISQERFEKECGWIKPEKKTVSADELEKWHKLFKEKAISKEQFEEKKAHILWKK